MEKNTRLQLEFTHTQLGLLYDTLALFPELQQKVKDLKDELKLTLKKYEI